MRSGLLDPLLIYSHDGRGSDQIGRLGLTDVAHQEECSFLAHCIVIFALWVDQELLGVLV